MKYHFLIKKKKIGYCAQCIELDGCIAQGDTRQELQKKMEDALNLYFQKPLCSKDIPNLPKQSIKKSENIVEVCLDPNISFSFLMKYHLIVEEMVRDALLNAINSPKT